MTSTTLCTNMMLLLLLLLLPLLLLLLLFSPPLLLSHLQRSPSLSLGRGVLKHVVILVTSTTLAAADAAAAAAAIPARPVPNRSLSRHVRCGQARRSWRFHKTARDLGKDGGGGGFRAAGALAPGSSMPSRWSEGREARAKGMREGRGGSVGGSVA